MIRFLTCAAVGFAGLLASAAPARAAITVFTDRAAFDAAVSTSTITFEGLAPPNSFTGYGTSLTVSGVTFQASPGTFNLNVIDPGFIPPQFQFPSGQFLNNNTLLPNTGIDLTLPGGTTALGFDVSFLDGSPDGVPNFVVTVSFPTGEAFTLTRPSQPTLSFLGFISDVALTTASVRSSVGNLVLDNVSVGPFVVAAVPEPASLALAGFAGVGLVGYRRLRRAA